MANNKVAVRSPTGAVAVYGPNDPPPENHALRRGDMLWIAMDMTDQDGKTVSGGWFRVDDLTEYGLVCSRVSESELQTTL